MPGEAGGGGLGLEAVPALDDRVPGRPAVITRRCASASCSISRTTRPGASITSKATSSGRASRRRRAAYTWRSQRENR